MLSHDHTM
uniref:Uncharacterized protein n=1 Tax=Vitis vinifera TaxID=29760 RepID=F6GWP4_VITVI